MTTPPSRSLDAAAVLFDIDGTLVDSTGVVERTWTSWSLRWGVDVDQVLRVCHGRRSVDTVALFVPAEHRDEALADLESLELADFGGVVALPAAQPLLTALPETRWAAVTSGPRTLMRLRLRAAGLPVPAVLVAAEDVSAGKPDPQGYLLAAHALGVDIKHSVVIEDSPTGIKAGRAAGARVIAVATSHPVTALTADVVVADLTHIKLGRATKNQVRLIVSSSTPFTV